MKGGIPISESETIKTPDPVGKSNCKGPGRGERKKKGHTDNQSKNRNAVDRLWTRGGVNGKMTPMIFSQEEK